MVQRLKGSLLHGQVNKLSSWKKPECLKNPDEKLNTTVWKEPPRWQVMQKVKGEVGTLDAQTTYLSCLCVCVSVLLGFAASDRITFGNAPSRGKIVVRLDDHRPPPSGSQVQDCNGPRRLLLPDHQTKCRPAADLKIASLSCGCFLDVWPTLGSNHSDLKRRRCHESRLHLAEPVGDTGVEASFYSGNCYFNSTDQALHGTQPGSKEFLRRNPFVWSLVSIQWGIQPCP